MLAGADVGRRRVRGLDGARRLPRAGLRPRGSRRSSAWTIFGQRSLGTWTTWPTVSQEQRRAIEAVLMVADSPVEPGMLAQLLEVAPRRWKPCATNWPVLPSRTPRFRPGQGGGRLRVPEPSRSGTLHRAPRARGPDGPAIGRRPRDAGGRGLQATDIPGSGGRHPRCQCQCRPAALCPRGYVCEVARDPGPGQAVLYGTSPLLLERLGLDEIEDLPPLGDFVPGPEIMDALEQGLRSG